jgi:hypothetical protein
MLTDVSGLVDDTRVVFRPGASDRPASATLRTLAIAAGLCVSVLFVVLGLRYGMQMYADGSLFSYAVAVRDAWAFHCHNISGRLTVYLFAFAPAEAYIRLTGDPRGGVALYGFLFFAAQLLGLLATFAADRSKGRIIFSYACVSTACLCPMVFGFPTEVWMTHALFWPTLALCHYARTGLTGTVLIFLALLALVFTHAGALISAAAILMTLALRGIRHPALGRAGGAFLAVVSIWIMVKLTLRPDPYVAAVLVRAALHVFDASILTGTLMLLLFGTLAAYGLAFAIFRRLAPTRAHLYAAMLVALALAVYWFRFDHALHAVNRYYLRTVLLVATPAFGTLAAAQALFADGELDPAIPLLPRVMSLLTGDVMARAAIGAIGLVLLIHAVETTKFVTAWTGYKAAVRALAIGPASDPALGDPRFVSSSRINADANRLSWFSTTPYLSVLLAPKLAPARLVVDPDADYFWLSCETATRSAETKRALPVEGRELVRVYSCLHRPARAPIAPIHP